MTDRANGTAQVPRDRATTRAVSFATTAFRDSAGVATGDSRLPPGTTLLGNAAILNQPLLALFCSVKCPGDLILQTYDLARALRDAGTAVISGFHTPMERECLDLLLRGTQPVVICPARGIGRMRLPTPWKIPIAEGRLLVASPFPPDHRRPTIDLAHRRNAFVAHLAAEVLVTYAHPNGTTARLATELAAAGKPLRTLDHPANAALLALGATPFHLSTPA